MKEELVTLDTARLLKEKGFNKYCENIIREDDGNLLKSVFRTNKDLPKLCYSQPSQSDTAKWLRENHGIHIVVYPTYRNDYGTEYRYKLFIFEGIGYKTITDRIWFEKYEEAFEYAIKESLKLTNN